MKLKIIKTLTNSICQSKNIKYIVTSIKSADIADFILNLFYKKTYTVNKKTLKVDITYVPTSKTPYNIYKFYLGTLSFSLEYFCLHYFNYLELLNKYVKEYYNLNDKEKANYDFNNKELIDIKNNITILNFILTEKILREVREDLPDFLEKTYNNIIKYHKHFSQDMIRNFVKKVQNDIQLNSVMFNKNLSQIYTKVTSNPWPFIELSIKYDFQQKTFDLSNPFNTNNKDHGIVFEPCFKFRDYINNFWNKINIQSQEEVL